MLRTILELTYFVTGGPGLLIAAIVGLRSLRLSKEAMILNERRAQLTSTTQQITSFAKEITPLFDALERHIEENEVTFFNSWNVHLTPDGAEAERTAEIENMDGFIATIPKFQPALNALSAWSSYFTLGVADEEAAYKTLCADFLHAAELCIPAVLLLEKTTAHSDMLSLYEAWRGRFEQEFLIDDIQESLARVHELHGITRKGSSR